MIKHVLPLVRAFPLRRPGFPWRPSSSWDWLQWCTGLTSPGPPGASRATRVVFLCFYSVASQLPSCYVVGTWELFSYLRFRYIGGPWVGGLLLVRRWAWPVPRLGPLVHWLGLALAGGGHLLPGAHGAFSGTSRAPAPMALVLRARCHVASCWTSLACPDEPGEPSLPSIGRWQRRQLTKILTIVWSAHPPGHSFLRKPRLRRRWGLRGVRVGEAANPGPPAPGTPLHPAIQRHRSCSPQDEPRASRRRVAEPAAPVRCFCPVPVLLSGAWLWGMAMQPEQAAGAPTKPCAIT